AAAEAKLREFGQSMMHVQELCRHWDKHAPATLKGAISSQGLIVPISQMSFPDLVALLGVHREKGDDAVVQWIRGQYDEIFCAAGFLDNLEATWAANSHLNRRLPLLQQSLKAHKLRMFAVSVPTLLAQFEGLVADATNHSGLMNGETMRRHVATLANGAHVTGGMLLSFVNDALLTQFGHGSLLPPFSRHAILHGGDVDYATEVNSRTAIFLIDNLRELTEP
ncbi:MAG TPA: hypothetical protein VGY54_12470, partial [Polyangiaceae bacterium]|nr:hypothetical protein [Polyangiaceae bacterium]